MDEPINIMLSEISQLSKTNAIWFYLYEVSGIVKSQGNKVQHGGYPSLSGKVNGESLINRDKLSV